jgi:hypothetical protein
MPVRPISLTTKPAQNAQMQALDRQRQLALLLKNQSLQPMDGGRMVGNHFVQNHPMQGIAKLGQALAGNYQLGQADRRARQLEETNRQNRTDTMNQLIAATKPKPDIPLAPDAQGNVPVRPTDPNAITNVLLGSQVPEYNQLGMEQVLKRTMPQERKLHNVAAGAVAIDEATGKPVYSNPKTPDSPISKEVQQVLYSQGVTDPTKATPEQVGRAVDLLNSQKIERAKAGASNMSINQKMEGKQAQERGKFYAEIRSDIDKSAFSAPVQIANVNRMEQLLNGIEGGALEGVKAKLASIAKSFGVNIDPNLGAKEAAIALANQMALGLRKEGTGVMTDKDFEVFLASVPTLVTSVEGRQEMMTTMRKKLERDVEISRMAREYAKNNNGLIDDGFLEQVTNYRAENPIFKPVESVPEYTRDATGKIIRKQ